MNLLLTKAYRVAYTIQVAVLGGCSQSIVEIAFQYGKNVGVAFQVNIRHSTNTVHVPIFSNKLSNYDVCDLYHGLVVDRDVCVV